MADVSAMLKYQELDMQVLRAEIEVEKSAERKAAVASHNAVTQAKEQAAAVEKQAEELIKFFEKTLAFYNENGKKIDELQKKFEQNPEGEEYDNYKGMLKKMLDSFSRLEQTLSGYDKSIKDALTKFAAAKAAAQKAMAEFKESRKMYDALRQEKQPQLDKLRAEMLGLQKQLDKDLFSRYAALRRDKTLPPVVKLMDKSCAGCRMELSMATVSELKQKGAIECEFCHRIIYYVMK